MQAPEQEAHTGALLPADPQAHPSFPIVPRKTFTAGGGRPWHSVVMSP